MLKCSLTVTSIANSHFHRSQQTNNQSLSVIKNPTILQRTLQLPYNYRSLTIGRIALLIELSNLGGSVREVGLVASMNLGFMGFLWNLQAVKRTGGSGQYFGLKLNKSTLYLPKIIGRLQQLTQVHDIQRCQEHV
jgi:hypothetical protein